MFLKNVFKFVFKLERNYMYFLLQAWQILLHLREYAGFYVLQHRLRRNGNSSKYIFRKFLRQYLTRLVVGLSSPPLKTPTRKLEPITKKWEEIQFQRRLALRDKFSA